MSQRANATIASGEHQSTIIVTFTTTINQVDIDAGTLTVNKTIITSIERIGIKKRIEQGLQQGRVEGLLSDVKLMEYSSRLS